MPSIYRTAFILRVQGYSIMENSRMINSSPTAIKTRIYRARQFLLRNPKNDP
ncbi:sigma factor-like helix-turn-helix DNA-binding protein [Gemmiger sp.]|uniref:sigma-70 region 4 domain-containing protein n=1 Tax=Gemmiger sp. TaxID=2049027 RepID=UPI003FA55309